MARASTTSDPFNAIAEPRRRHILEFIAAEERSVTEIAAALELGQPSVSKHLQVLHSAGFVKRRRDGLFTYYALADRRVFKLCDIMCGRLGAESATRRRIVVR